MVPRLPLNTPARAISGRKDIRPSEADIAQKMIVQLQQRALGPADATLLHPLLQCGRSLGQCATRP
jgi:hypothetical protein